MIVKFFSNSCSRTYIDIFFTMLHFIPQHK